MEVIKKDGRIQKFDLEKIKTSIMRASDDINQPMNSSDINTIADKIKDDLISLRKGKIRSSQIHDIVIDELYKNGFGEIAKSYNIEI